jgi:hypothetical protein
MKSPGGSPANGAGSCTYAIWEQVKQRRELFDGACVWSATRFNVASGDQTEFADGLFASGRVLDTFGAPAILGRTFTEKDDVRGGGRDGAVAVISDSFWQRRFGGVGDVIGRSIALDRVPY